MRRIPNIGSLEEMFDESGDADRQARRPGDARRPGAAPAPESRRQPDFQSADESRRASRGTEDTISLDGLTIDEILALSDAPPPDPADGSNARDDTGEWDAIEDMLDPSIMLRGNAEEK